MELKNKMENNSRREFLKKAGIFSGLLLMGYLRPFKLFADGSRFHSESLWYGVGIDIKKCIGCGRCVDACKKENNVPNEPFYFRTWVEQYTIKTDGEIIVESPNGGREGFKQSVSDEEIYKTFFVPKLCNHCYKSPCVQVCPVGATYHTEDGVVLVDDSYCIGCRYCIQACPYGCRFLHPVKKVAAKCTYCYHRVKKGMNPACMEVCPTNARIFGDINNKNGELALFLRKHTTHVLKPHLNTGSKLYYNELNKEVR